MARERRRRTSLAPDAVALLAVAIAAAALIVWRVTVAVRVGPGWDTFAFLANAAEFAGRGYGYTELHRPPFLSLLTATAFRLGAPLHESVIQWLDGTLSFSGIVAFYLLARRRFAPALAATASVGLLAVQPLWLYLGSGYTDFPSVAIALWFLLALIAATEKNAWYYTVAALLFVAAVLTRYTALLMLFPGLLWFAFRGSLFRHARMLAASVGLGVLAYLPMGRFYGLRFGDGLFPFVFALTVTEAVTAPGGEGSVSAAGPYYIANLPAFLAGKGYEVFGWIALVGAVLGLFLGGFAYLARLRPAAKRIALAVLGLGVAVAGQFGGLFVRQFSLPIGVFLVWRALALVDEKTGHVSSTSALDAVMLLSLLTYFDFHGHQAIQVPRYVVTMAPSLLYFIALGWWQSVADIGRTLNPKAAPDAHRPWRSQTAAAMGLALVLAFAVGSTVATTSHQPDALVAGARESAEWLNRHVGALGNDELYSDLWPVTAWYARRPTRPMPFFRELPAYQHELDKNAVEYFVTVRGRRFEGYEETATAGPVTVLERVARPQRSLPRVAYLGKAWENYLESVTDYSFYLTGDPGRYGWEGSAFLDEPTGESLKPYDAVAAYDVKWRDRAAGEAALEEYLRSGGSVVMDASGNIGELPYELGNTVMFDTVIKRGAVPEQARVTVDPAFARAHPDIGPITAAPFVDETGGGWFGAEYSELPGAAPLRVLASVDGQPAIAVRGVGKGRIYWIGYNLVWHAFIGESSSEARLIRAVFDDAMTHTRQSRGAR